MAECDWVFNQYGSLSLLTLIWNGGVIQRTLLVKCEPIPTQLLAVHSTVEFYYKGYLFRRHD